MDDATRAAFERLLKIALQDSGQCRRVANFILAWWNAEDLGGFDLADLFALDQVIVTDMITVFAFVAHSDAYYPKHYRGQIEQLIQQWRPEVWAKYEAAS